MRVRVESAGGFAGVERVLAEIDTAGLPEARVGEVRDAVAAIAEWAGQGGGPGEIGADLMTYRITVDGARVYTISGDPPGSLDSPLGVLLRP